MLLLETSCLAIIALYLAFRVEVERDRPRLLRRLGLLVLASWMAENSVIHAYHFYQYSPRWSLFVDQVPLLIVLIWPIVILSAWDLVRALAGGGGPRAALLTAALVFADAYVMEPIAVASGLWSWNAPGLFGVPPIGVLGWSLFTAACLLVIDWVDRRRKNCLWDLLMLLVPLPLVHLSLVALWWAIFRWVSLPIPDLAGVVIAWAGCLLLASLAARHPATRRVPRRDLLLRVPASGFFFVLLGIHGREQPALVAFALAFALPYLVLTARARSFSQSE
ncbi:MAG: carotenoid biosynthesis protein [Polyangia bacterium]|nr:carotenoid biosynthesis protein [Polyangia bacterium]